jgi:hypothetical protein
VRSHHDKEWLSGTGRGVSRDTSDAVYGAAPNRCYKSLTLDDNTRDNVWKKGGQPGVTAKVSVSKDGKTLTVSLRGTDAKGAPVSSVAVYDYDRQ